MFTEIDYSDYLKHKESVKSRYRIDYNSIYVNLCDIPCKVNWHVNKGDCLMLPEHYRFPKDEKYVKNLQHIIIALKNKRHTYIWGPSGCGKDSFIHAYCNMTRTPSEIFTIQPGIDIQSWFFVKDFNKDGTFFTEGSLLKMLRDGYTTKTGEKLPYLILISDFDRADKNQAESLRLIMDSIKGRIKGQHGITYPVFPGSVIAFTGNSPGSGDLSGKYLSSNPIDISLFERIERKFKLTNMSWEDERLILESCYPLLFSECKTISSDLRSVISKIRLAIENEEVFADFSTRSLKNWLGHASDLLKETGDTTHILARSMRAWTDGLPDEESRLKIVRLADPLLKGINPSSY